MGYKINPLERVYKTYINDQLKIRAAPTRAHNSALETAKDFLSNYFSSPVVDKYSLLDSMNVVFKLPEISK